MFLKWIPSLPPAEDESEPEEEEDRSGDDAKEPRDSGCFESSENLEAKTEEQVKEEEEEQRNKEEEKEEKQELDAVQEQLQELTVEEGS